MKFFLSCLTVSCVLLVACGDDGRRGGSDTGFDTGTGSDAGTDSGGRDSGGTDTGGTDSGGTDSGGRDIGSPDVPGVDAPVVDGGPADVAPDAMDAGVDAPVGCGMILSSPMGASVASGSTVGAGDDILAPSCHGGAGESEDVAFTWTAPTTATWSIDTFGSDFDSTLSVRTGDCAGTEVACNDDAGSDSQSRVLVPATAGTEYFIVIEGYSGDAGNYVLNISEGLSGCPTHTVTAVGASVATGSTDTAEDSFDPSCTDGSTEATVSFTAPTAGNYVFDTLGSDFDTVLYVLDGSCGGLELACNDDTVDTRSEVTVAMTAGQEVTVVVDGYDGDSGDYVLNVAMGTSGGLAAGDIIVTEIANNPNVIRDEDGEWFEVFNTTGSDVELLGCVIGDDGADAHTIGSSLVVPAGGYATLAIGASPGFTPDYVYSTFFLGNGVDEVIVTCGGVELDRVVYDDGATFPDPAGASMQLDNRLLNDTDNDLGANWCLGGPASYDGGDNLGTPGAANGLCS